MMFRILMGVVVYTTATMFYSMHLLTKYIGIAAYALIAGVVGIVLAFPVAAVETALYGGEIGSGLVILGVSGGLFVYYVSYDHSPTSDTAIFGGFRECIRMGRNMTGQAQSSPVRAVAIGAKLGFEEGRNTESTIEGLGVVLEATMALWETILASARAREFTPDIRVVENVWLFDLVLEPAKAATKIADLSHDYPRRRQLAALYLNASVEEYGIVKILSHADTAPEQLAADTVALLQDTDDITRVHASGLLYEVVTEHARAVGMQSDSLLEYLNQQRPADVSHENVLLSVSEIATDSHMQITRPEEFLSAVATLIDENNWMRPTGCEAFFCFTVHFADQVVEYDQYLISFIEDAATDIEMPEDPGDPDNTEDLSEMAGGIALLLRDVAVGLAGLAVARSKGLKRYETLLNSMATHKHPILRYAVCDALSIFPTGSSDEALRRLGNDDVEQIAAYAGGLLAEGTSPEKVSTSNQKYSA